MRDGGNLFDNLSRRPYFDEIDVAARIRHIKLYLIDISNSTEGLVTTEGLVRASSVLDLGMGRGALGIYLRSEGMKGRLVGLDSHDYTSEGLTGYERYDRTELSESIQEVVDRNGLGNERFDYVVCIAPSPELLDWILVNFRKIPLSDNGKIVIQTEHEPRVDHEFDLYNSVSLLKNIFLR